MIAEAWCFLMLAIAVVCMGFAVLIQSYQVSQVNKIIREAILESYCLQDDPEPVDSYQHREWEPENAR